MIIFSLISCECEIKQLPTQYVPVNENCEAFLPDYTKIVEAPNCDNIITQSPPPGILIGNGKKVTLKTKDKKVVKSTFHVYKTDTINPEIKIKN